MGWHAAMAAVWDHGQPRVDHLARLGAPAAIGLDETSFLAATATHPTLLVTGILDLDTGRLVDVLPARSARAVTDWLASKPAPWRAGIRHVVIDPYQPYATAVAAQLPDARLVVDHFHVIRLANTALDEVRRRVQHTTLGHRGHKGDPLYRIRRRLLAGHERLDPAGFARVLAWLDVGDPDGEVAACYLAKELLRETYLADHVFDARRRLTVFYDHCTASGVPELERLARTIARWETPILRWHRTRLTNAATEGTNLIVKNIKRLGFGFRNFDNYRLRLLLRCGAPWQHQCRRTNTTPPPTRSARRARMLVQPHRRHSYCDGLSPIDYETAQRGMITTPTPSVRPGYFQPRHRRHREEPGDKEEPTPRTRSPSRARSAAPAVPTCVDAVEFGASKEYESLKQP